MIIKRLLAIAVVCCLAAVGFTAAAAVPASGSDAQANVHVGFKVGKFTAHGHRLVAHGEVTTTVTTPNGGRTRRLSPSRPS